MQTDIRDLPSLEHEDIVALNFINSKGGHIFRRYPRQGLRSHIMEILEPGDIEVERTGILVDGVRLFPRARPKRVLRVFRTRFTGSAEALAEIQRVKMVERYLTSDCIAQSIEIVAEYHGPDGRGPLLCGIQEYVAGVVLDVWSLLTGDELLHSLYESLATLQPEELKTYKSWSGDLSVYAGRFVDRVKALISAGQHIPDLAGNGNVLIDASGCLKLVDINNISEVAFEDHIRLDDRGYPVCDKSIEALALIEEKLLGRKPHSADSLYSFFLKPSRKVRVRAAEQRFFHKAESTRSITAGNDAS